MIAAQSSNRVIGKDGGLPWHMPGDEAFFLNEIEGCLLLSGRKSYESNQGNTIFKNKEYIIITRKTDYNVGPGGSTAASLEAGIQLAKEQQIKRLCVLGGGEIYKQALPFAHKLIITEIHTLIDQGSAFFPEIDPGDWALTRAEPHPADKDNPFPYTFKWYHRKVN